MTISTWVGHFFFLIGEAIAAQSPEFTIAGNGGLNFAQDLAGHVETTVRMAFGRMLVLGDWDAGANGFANVQWRTVAAKNLDRRPFGQHRQGRGAEVLKFLSAINHLATHDC